MCILNRLKIIALLVILIGIVVEYPKPMVIIGGLRFKCDVCDVRDVMCTRLSLSDYMV